MNLLQLDFILTECEGWPKAKIYIDEHLYEDKKFITSNEVISVPLHPDIGEHCLCIELYDKTSKNTKQNEFGEIVQDQLITLNKVIIDDIVIPAYFMYSGVYNFNGQSIKQSLSWGVNGTWKWNFSTPIITWLLDEKIKNVEKYYTPEVSYYERLVLEDQRLRYLEEQLRNV